VPFDILEAESELIAGFSVALLGMKFALIQIGEYRQRDSGTSFMGAMLFLGAWSGPWFGHVGDGPGWARHLRFRSRPCSSLLLVTDPLERLRFGWTRSSPYPGRCS